MTDTEEMNTNPFNPTDDTNPFNDDAVAVEANVGDDVDVEVAAGGLGIATAVDVDGATNNDDVHVDVHVDDNVDDNMLDDESPETKYFKMMMQANQMGRTDNTGSGGVTNDDDAYGMDGDSVIGGATLASMLNNNTNGYNNADGSGGGAAGAYDNMSVDSYGYSLANSNNYANQPSATTTNYQNDKNGMILNVSTMYNSNRNDDVNGNDIEKSMAVGITGGAGANHDGDDGTGVEVDMSIVGIDNNDNDDVSTIANDTVNQDSKAFFQQSAPATSTPRIRLFKEYMTPEKKKKKNTTTTGSSNNITSSGGGGGKKPSESSTEDDNDDATAPETPPGMIRVPSKNKRSKSTSRGGRSLMTSSNGGNASSKKKSSSSDGLGADGTRGGNKCFQSKRCVYIFAVIVALVLLSSIIALGVALGGMRKNDDTGSDTTTSDGSTAAVSTPGDGDSDGGSTTEQIDDILNDWPEVGGVDDEDEDEGEDGPSTGTDPENGGGDDVPAQTPTESPVAADEEEDVEEGTLAPSETPPKDPDVIFQDMLPILENQGVSVDFVDSPTSPQYQALQWLSFDPNFKDYSEERATQRWVLAVLANSLDPVDFTPVTPPTEITPTTMGGGGGRHRRRLEIAGWLGYDDECSWFTSTAGRPTCNINGQYQHIHIQELGLSGQLPAELSLLSNSLTSINLNGNNIFGEIPTEFGSLSLLQSLRLRRNNLNSTIPTEIGDLVNLATLDLGINNITSTIPLEIGDMTSLSVLTLDSNALTGQVPRSIGDLSNSLVELRIQDNSLEGRLPNEISRLDLLEILMTSGNSFTQMPRNFCELEDLAIVSVDCYLLEDCECCTECPETESPTIAPTVFVPPTPSPTNRPTDACGDSVSISQSCYEPGDSIDIVLSNCNAEDDDWLGIYPADEDVSSLPNPVVWSWACGSRNCREAVTSNSFSLDQSHAGGNQWPLEEGTYMVVLARNSAQPYTGYARTVSFTVEDSC